MGYSKYFYNGPPRELYLVQEGACWRVYFSATPAKAARTRYNNRWGGNSLPAMVWRVSLDKMEEVD